MLSLIIGIEFHAKFKYNLRNC